MTPAAGPGADGGTVPAGSRDVMAPREATTTGAFVPALRARVTRSCQEVQPGATRPPGVDRHRGEVVGLPGEGGTPDPLVAARPAGERVPARPAVGAAAPDLDLDERALGGGGLPGGDQLGERERPGHPGRAPPTGLVGGAGEGAPARGGRGQHDLVARRGGAAGLPTGQLGRGVPGGVGDLARLAHRGRGPRPRGGEPHEGQGEG